MVTFDDRSLGVRLEWIGPRWSFLFALAVAERLFPLYKLFSEITRQGATGRLRSTLDQLWEDSLNAQTPYEHAFIREYEALIPGDDVERSKRTLLDPLAEDAVSAIAYACYYQATRDTKNAVWAAQCAYDTVDYIAHGLENMEYDTPEARAAVLKMDYIQAELQRQVRDLVELERAAREGAGVERIAETLQNRAQGDGNNLAELVTALWKKTEEGMMLGAGNSE